MCLLRCQTLILISRWQRNSRCERRTRSQRPGSHRRQRISRYPKRTSLQSKQRRSSCMETQVQSDERISLVCFGTFVSQVQQVKPCWGFQAPKETMGSQDSQE